MTFLFPRRRINIDGEFSVFSVNERRTTRGFTSRGIDAGLVGSSVKGRTEGEEDLRGSRRVDTVPQGYSVESHE